jgi:shikimate dehydrogenase
MKISGKTRVCGVIGDPVEHSLSPSMHNAAFKELNLDFTYVAFRVRMGELKEAIVGARSLDIHGLNATMPHKNVIAGYLDEIDPKAKSIGAVNTILNNEGKLIGYNTDGVGALRALKENGITPTGKKILLLGAGGAGKAIAFYAAQEAEELVILNRTPQKAEKLADVLHREFDKRIIGKDFSPKIIGEELKDADILVNATSVGMHPNVNRSLVPPNSLKTDLYVMDIIYSPLDTKLLQDAKAAGAKVISGIEMLLHQGAASFEIWTNRQAPVKVMKHAVLNKLAELGANQ